MGAFALALKRLLPDRLWQTIRIAAGRPVWPPADHYRALYEAHSRDHRSDDVIGAGSFDLIGRMELALLLKAGMKPTDTVLDFGCGVGRLAVYLVPVLNGGHYIGTDIAQAILDRDMMNALAEMTGWTPAQWFAGDEANILIPGAAAPQALGQSVCVLEPK